jgi:hypothetical protein
MESKQLLLEKLIKHPLEFNDLDFEQIVDPTTGLSFDDLRNALKRVYNINESALRTESDATTGGLGIFNRYTTRRRQKAYFNKINAGFVGEDGHKVIVAEGDSWFQFFGRDVINWLERFKTYAIFSIAYAGDWLANILFEEKYVEELSIHKPSAFLVSGGGNDLVGGDRLAIMTCLNPHSFIPLKRTNKQELLVAGCSEEQANQILSVQQHILPEFHAFILILKCQYFLLFNNLRKAADLETMAILTQGYDYAIPHAGIRFDWRTPLQPLINWLIGSGKWLSEPLMIRGIKEQKRQRAIIMAMIFELNEMFISLAKRNEFPYLYHIDSRGNAIDKDWFDELHLKPWAFKRVADTYRRCLDNHFEHIKRTQVGTKNPNYHFLVKQPPMHTEENLIDSLTSSPEASLTVRTR